MSKSTKPGPPAKGKRPDMGDPDSGRTASGPPDSGRTDSGRTDSGHTVPQPGWAEGLRKLYDNVVAEPLPDHFEALLKKLDQP